MKGARGGGGGLLARLIGGERIEAAQDEALAKTLVSRGLAWREGDFLALTDLGRSRLGNRKVHRSAQFADGRRLGSVDIVEEDGSRRRVPANLDESPLARLRRIKGRDGRRAISQAEFDAGERLRLEFERGRLTPQITMNWSAALPSRGRGSRGSGDLTETAMTARRNVEIALGAVGQDLGGLLLDFCCFLKGLETIERERGWPVRSAKVVIALALRSLARHYRIEDTAAGPKRDGKLRHWGSPDYRPKLDAEA